MNKILSSVASAENTPERPPGTSGEEQKAPEAVRNLEAAFQAQASTQNGPVERGVPLSSQGPTTVPIIDISPIENGIVSAVKVITESQKEVMMKFLEMKEKDKEEPRIKSSVFTFDTRIQMPQLGDDGPSSRLVTEFLDKYESMCKLANEVTDTDKITLIKRCLKGSKEKVYDNLIRATKATKQFNEDPAGVYEELKRRLLRFAETPRERQVKALKRYDDLRMRKGEDIEEFPSMGRGHYGARNGRTGQELHGASARLPSKGRPQGCRRSAERQAGLSRWENSARTRDLGRSACDPQGNVRDPRQQPSSSRGSVPI
jgi:hypothetical protein